jgi:hypothetical integral membrane protein (TIGR02206 family)
MTTNFKLFGVTHLGILSSVVLLAVALALVQRRLAPGSKVLRLALAAVLALDTVAWDAFLAWRGQLTFPAHLPVEFCDATLYVLLLALFTMRPVFLELAYYWALAGTSMALLTPDLWEPFPSLSTVQFFVAHGLVVSAALYLAWSRQARPCKGSVARAMLGVNLWVAFDGTLDWLFKTNYMYLRAKPAHPSLLDLLGPWPWYLVTTEGVACGLFLLLYLPFWRSAALPSAHKMPNTTNVEAPASRASW